MLNKLLNKIKTGIKSWKKQEFLPSKSYYQDLINPYKIIFNPSYLEVNDNKLVDFMLLNDMSGEKTANYLHPLLKYAKKSKISLFFSPIDTSKLIEEYKKVLIKLKNKRDNDLETGKEVDKKLEKIIEDYTEMIEDYENGQDNFLNYSILYSHEISKDNEGYEEIFQDERIALRKFFAKNLQQPTKFYCPVWQIEESYLSQQPLCEYRLKDWSNISAINGMTLYPFFTETKDPSVKDWVPYGINRNTGELFFFNHSELYNSKEITNRNLNVFWGTGAWKTSFFRSQVPLRISYWDHFIIFDPKRDYVAFTKDMWGQNISFSVDKPMWFNLFYRNPGFYKELVEVDWVIQEVDREIQSIEKKKQNLIKIISIMAPYLWAQKDRDAEFSLSILDSAISKVYNDDPTGSTITLQIFYDKYLKDSIEYFSKNEPEKISNYTQAWERLKTNLSAFVIKEDWSKWRYYKMFLPVEKEQELQLQDWPLINFDLSQIFHDDKLFTIGALIWFEFTWTQIAWRKWKDRTLYVVIDENWKLLKYEQAGEYEEAFSRLIRWLGGGIYTFSQNLTEYIESPSGQQVLDQAQVNIVLKLETNQLERLKSHFPTWFTKEINEDFDRINQSKRSYWQWYIYMKSRAYPFKYLYLPSISWRDSWQEAESWQANLDTQSWFENK